MGMDVFGLNPKIKEGSVKPEEIDWGKATQEEKDKYIEAKSKYEDENVGVYFRNNVWFWRPLWNYVYDTTDVLTEKDFNLGHENSCHKISATKAERIGKALLKNMEHAEKVEKEYKEDVIPKEKFNKLCEKAANYLYDEIVDKSDGKITCPGDMKIHDPANYKRWSTLAQMGGGLQFTMTSYPFSAKNVKKFAEFCLNSGGFEIG